MQSFNIMENGQVDGCFFMRLRLFINHYLANYPDKAFPFFIGIEWGKSSSIPRQIANTQVAQLARYRGGIPGFSPG
jgi:hypothetical protein